MERLYFVEYLTYLLFLKERGFLNASLGCAIEIVLPSLDVRLKSPNALWRLYSHFTRKPSSKACTELVEVTGLVSRYSRSICPPDCGKVANIAMDKGVRIYTDNKT